jgi:enterochelin esterase-like enzyme
MKKLWSIVIVSIAIAFSFYLRSCQQKGNAYPSPYRLAATAERLPILAPNSQVYLDHKVFKSTAHGTTIPYAIMLPASYFVNPHSGFPVILWLHGAAGGRQSIAPLTSRFRRAMDLRVMKESIVVFPESNPLSMWVNSKDNTYMIENIIVKELLPHVVKSYNAISSDHSATVAGFSMGGYGAARLGLKYPQIFNNVLVIGAGTLDESLDNTPRADSAIRDNVLNRVFGNSNSYFYQQSPRYFAKNNVRAIKQMNSRFTIIVGSDDEVLDQNLSFSQYLDSLGIEPRLIVLPGVRHNLKDYFTVGGPEIFTSLLP